MIDTSQLLVVSAVLVSLALIIFVLFLHATASFPNMSRCKSEEFFLNPNKDGRPEKFPSIDDSASVDLTVIVPAYNEQDRLPLMMDEAMLYLEQKQKDEPNFSYEVIVVDDGSKDRTSQVALHYSKEFTTEKVRVLTLQQNKGKGGAIRMGMLSGRGKYMMFADADGATKFSDLDRLQREMERINTEEHGMALVCGSRAHLQDDSVAQRSVFRTILMYGFHLLVLLCVHGLKDTQCGFKLFTRNASRLLFNVMHVDRWAFDVDLLHIAQHYRMPIAEVAVNWQEIEGSKLSPLWASLQMFRDLILIRLRYLTGAWKMTYRLKNE
ncbi:hypothetical protein CAPTEDRAFT_18905 [Capitella teleta]|uniref:Dolichyl-phosphate beta-glucosyltransferase n=1 Tax=Capitella teleta TaxID=283909 RepID=R7TJP3_CAPTE|nr:hypothetical protein CAPTEDRAFT_18905 [Capitella teleta]|eukprot:ELT94048.1 hypothetical protein CAPTEDRAFT_18905 [Capitella teleta]